MHSWYKLAYLIFTAGMMTQASAAAAPYRSNQGNTQPSDSGTLRSLHENIEAMRHSHRNQENQLRELDQKFETIDAIIDSLRKQLHDSSKAHKDSLTSSTSNLETKVGDLELAVKGAAIDLRELKDHANETTAALTQYQQRLRELEKLLQQQSQQIDNLQSALKSVTEILSKGSEDVATKVYRVKSGDSLDKIAQAHQTSVKVIKELNNLNHDRININQKLKIPEK